MEIRKVQIKDLPQIKSIADSLVVTSGDSGKNFGFYDYSLTTEQYERRSQSDLFLVVSQETNLEGFCMAYDSEFVRRLVKQEPQLNDDVIFRYLVELKERYVYIDQFAVRKPKTSAGNSASYELWTRLVEQSKNYHFMLGAIPHQPWRNEDSIRFFTKRGGNLIQEIGNKIIFGVYRLELV